jgi:O-antigen/teichoic acid export membrane protein
VSDSRAPRELDPLSRHDVHSGPDPARAVGRIARGLAAHLGGMGVSVLVQLVSVPVMLAAWGVPTYGQWLVLSAVPTYIGLSDLSFASVAGNSMVMLEASGRHADAVMLGRRLWSIVSVMSAGAVLIAALIALSLGHLIGPEAPIPAAEAQIVLLALFLHVGVSNQFGVLDAWYRAGGRYPSGAALRQFTRLLEFGALLAAVIAGARPGGASLAFLAAGVAGYLLSWVYLRRVVPWATFVPERPHAATIRELAGPGIAFAAFPIGNALALQGFTIVVGATLGAAAVVVFATTRTITRVALQGMASINSAIAPELSRSVGGGRLPEARAILRRSVQLSLVVAGAVVAGLALFGGPIIRWWTNGLVDPPAVVLYLLLLVIIANSVWYTLSAALIATNRHTRIAGLYLAGTVAALLVSIPLSTLFGLAGAAAALLVIDIAMVIYVFPAALHVVQDAPSHFLRSLLYLPNTLRPSA